MKDRECIASSKFACSTSERCAFEAGIKLATVYHQFVGVPFNGKTVETLEESIEKAISVQPYVNNVIIKINRNVIPDEKDEYSYVSLTGDMIDASVTIEIDGILLIASMKYDNELQYPLMFIERIGRIE